MNKLHIVPALQDNYIWLLENSSKQVVIIDPSESDPVIDFLNTNNLTPIAILLTHHHKDHTGGVIELTHNYLSLPVFAPKEVQLPIATTIAENKIIINDLIFSIIQVPGHTLGHVAYYLKSKSNSYLFCGDTLFSGGCGRVSEGTYQQMLSSLNKLKALPEQTIVCPAHEYTTSNLEFALHLLPDDLDISIHYKKANMQKITLPTTIKQEKIINLFLRCNEKSLQSRFNCVNELSLFQFFRDKKNIF